MKDLRAALILNTPIWAAIFLIVIIKLAYYKFAHFLFYATYTDYKNWFPNYYIAVFTSIWLFKIGLVTISAAYIVKYSRLILEATRKLTASFQALPQHIGFDKDYALNRGIVSQFIATQILLLLLSLSAYYCLRLFNLQHIIFQLEISRAYILLATLTSLFFIYGNVNYFAQAAYSFLFTPTSAFNLSIYRILFFALLAHTYSITLQSSLPFIEAKPREALPLIGWLIEIMPISKGLYQGIAIAGMVSCAFLVVGLFTRFFVVLNAFLVFYIIAVPNFYGKLWHSQLPIWISWFLLLANLNGKFALDNLLFPKTRNHTLSPNHTFPIRIVWLQIGMIYFWAGFHKLWVSGFDWALSQSMINQVRLEWFEHFDKLPFFRIDQYPHFLYAAGMLTILFELLYPFLLFHNRLKYISIIGGLVLHNLLDAFMYIGFQQLQHQYVVFISYEKIYYNVKSFFNKGFIPPVLRPQYSINKPLVWLSLTILFSNFVFGALRINSFPFSVYPTYTDLIGCEKTYLYFDPIDADMSMNDIRVLAQASNFRWENFSRIDYKICDTYNNEHKVDTMQIRNVWKWWTSAMPALADIDTLDIYAVRRSLNPDSADIIINKRHLIRIYPNEKL